MTTPVPPPPTEPKHAPQFGKPLAPDTAERSEKDKGYNESHGYGPGHGGPSGPGDAPSTSPATVVPPADDAPEE